MWGLKEKKSKFQESYSALLVYRREDEILRKERLSIVWDFRERTPPPFPFLFPFGLSRRQTVTQNKRWHLFSVTLLRACQTQKGSAIYRTNPCLPSSIDPLFRAQDQGFPWISICTTNIQSPAGPGILHCCEERQVISVLRIFMWLLICLGEEQGVPSIVSKVLPLAFSPIPQDKVTLCYSFPHDKHTCLPEPKFSHAFCLCTRSCESYHPLSSLRSSFKMPVSWYASMAMFKKTPVSSNTRSHACQWLTCTANDPCDCGLVITIAEIMASLKSDISSEAVRSLAALPEDRIMSVLDSWLVPKNISC